MSDLLYVGVMLASTVGLGTITLYRGVKIRRLKHQLREAKS